MDELVKALDDPNKTVSDIENILKGNAGTMLVGGLDKETLLTLFRKGAHPGHMTEIARLLINSHASIHEEDGNGNCPLDFLVLHINRGLRFHTHKSTNLSRLSSVGTWGPTTTLLSMKRQLEQIKEDEEYQNDVYNCLMLILSHKANPCELPGVIPNIPSSTVWSEHFEHRLFMRDYRWRTLGHAASMEHNAYQASDPLSRAKVQVNSHNIQLIHLAAWRGDARCLTLMLLAGCNPNAISDDGRNPLHYLYNYCSKPRDLYNNTLLLIKAGTAINRTDHSYMYPLHYLIQHIFNKRTAIKYLANAYTYDLVCVKPDEDHYQKEIMDCVRLLMNPEKVYDAANIAIILKIIHDCQPQKPVDYSLDIPVLFGEKEEEFHRLRKLDPKELSKVVADTLKKTRAEHDMDTDDNPGGATGRQEEDMETEPPVQPQPSSKKHKGGGKRKFFGRRKSSSKTGTDEEPLNPDKGGAHSSHRSGNTSPQPGTSYEPPPPHLLEQLPQPLSKEDVDKMKARVLVVMYNQYYKNVQNKDPGLLAGGTMDLPVVPLSFSMKPLIHFTQLFLEEYQVNVNTSNRDGKTALHYLIDIWRVMSENLVSDKNKDDLFALVDLLMKHGADCNMKPRTEWHMGNRDTATATETAIRFLFEYPRDQEHNSVLVKKLLQAGGNPMAWDWFSWFIHTITETEASDLDTRLKKLKWGLQFMLMNGGYPYLPGQEIIFVQQVSKIILGLGKIFTDLRRTESRNTALEIISIFVKICNMDALNELKKWYEIKKDDPYAIHRVRDMKILWMLLGKLLDKPFNLQTLARTTIWFSMGYRFAYIHNAELPKSLVEFVKMIVEPEIV